MIIDYDRLILLLLPIRLRTVRLFSLLNVFVAPIRRLHDEFHVYAELRRLRASATPQALMIERIVLSETGVNITIKPVTATISPDFEVVHPDDAPAEEVLAAKSVIDRYKLAGKTYRVAGSVIPFTHEYTDFKCVVNQITAADSAEWIDKLCAVAQQELTNNTISFQYDNGKVRVVAQYAVASNLTITADFYWQNGSQSGVINKLFVIALGQTQSTQQDIAQFDYIRMHTGSVNPQSDYDYQYITI